MAKAAIRRHHTERLHKNWKKLLGSLDFSPSYIEMYCFGRAMSSDPLDCGNPRCKVCHSDKVLHPKRRRAENKRLSQEELENLGL